MQKTYLDLLAEQDTEARADYVNPKDLLVEHNVFDQEVNGDDHHEDELEHQEDFQKFGGSHQQASALGELSPTKATHTTSVEYDKAVQIHVVSVDSRFRTNRLDSTHSFLYKLDTQIKNVVSVRVSSIEIPNTWYAFSTYRGNTTFTVTSISGPTAQITLPQGNYSLNENLDDNIQDMLASLLNTAFPGYGFLVSYNTVSSLLSIEASKSFSLDFSDGPFAGRFDNWGLGYSLGFRDSQFSDFATTGKRETVYSTKHTTDALPDMLGGNYIFLSLNPDWRIVEHNHPDHSNLAAFAKIIVDVNKNDIIYDNGSNLLTKTYTLKQPTNISSFKVSLYDEYGQFLRLKGGEVSLTLEVTEIVNSALYESLRN